MQSRDTSPVPPTPRAAPDRADEQVEALRLKIHDAIGDWLQESVDRPETVTPSALVNATAISVGQALALFLEPEELGIVVDTLAANIFATALVNYADHFMAGTPSARADAVRRISRQAVAEIGGLEQRYDRGEGRHVFPEIVAAFKNAAGEAH
ncbi:MAG: hypothetical protein H6907_04230 [Hyphomicrobiales bacterium]|nr:hypothetical protein [Hyphomicrobiales bacterium]